MALFLLWNKLLLGPCSLFQIIVIHDIVPFKNRSCFVTCYLHCHAFWHTCTHLISNSGAAKIVKKAIDPCPFTCLLPGFIKPVHSFGAFGIQKNIFEKILACLSFLPQLVKHLVQFRIKIKRPGFIVFCVAGFKTSTLIISINLIPGQANISSSRQPLLYPNVATGIKWFGRCVRTAYFTIDFIELIRIDVFAQFDFFQ